ncbi:S-adenosyl-L-methionine-dependent methyltransferase [Coniochaeta ligniaria NRRL 30616]|uniref:S-adenosyl-L-methionine-dependent methyltransferase n=1 Tax=Coniochaeta ligniaria NRRL 30616 TaxID=1408157 RepID=A0A1J7IJQ2_9PEZI|nr:S-adenosyl-L-methionine-dependent methyltransferase [Coniochaeta ligniaria NRRL 30616]
MLTDAAKGLRRGTSASPEQHAGLVEILKRVVELVHGPRDDIMDTMTGFCQIAVIRLFIKWKVFEKIPVAGIISYKELAAVVGADVSLITRLCWLLVATGVLRQEGPHRVAHTKKSEAYTTVAPLRAQLQMGFDEYMPPILAMPRYFDAYGLKEPTGKLHSVKAFAEGEPEISVTDLMNRHSKRVATMLLALSAMEKMYPHSGLYDFSWVAARAAESPGDRPLIVDVGGGNGHTLRAIYNDTPGLPISRCVLEDLPEVIEVAKTTADNGRQRPTTADKEVLGARLVGMDFFKEQPVKGALIYHTLRCDLEAFGDAMAPDSKVLVGEIVMSNPPAQSAAMMDMLLGTIGGKERTIEGFHDIAGRAGLQITAVSRGPRDVVIMECEKV